MSRADKPAAAPRLARPRREKPRTIRPKPVYGEVSGPVLVDATNAKPWLQRAFGECAYIVAGEGADSFSCCAPVSGGPYCAGHRAIMYAGPGAATVHRTPTGKSSQKGGFYFGNARTAQRVVA